MPKYKPDFTYRNYNTTRKKISKLEEDTIKISTEFTKITDFKDKFKSNLTNIKPTELYFDKVTEYASEWESIDQIYLDTNENEVPKPAYIFYAWKGWNITIDEINENLISLIHTQIYYKSESSYVPGLGRQVALKEIFDTNTNKIKKLIIHTGIHFFENTLMTPIGKQSPTYSANIESKLVITIKNPFLYI